MDNRDRLEIRKRFNNETTISRMAGCYVDSNKNKVLSLNETFLNLPEDEFYKYLDIAKKTLSGTIGNNILELKFPEEEEQAGGKQQILRGIRESKLENEELLNAFYDLIIEKFNFAGNFIILLFHDSYDVMTKTSDNIKLDESEEVFDYLLVSICPVGLSKPGLGYRVTDNRIGAIERDWMVGAPEVGFLFPAFDGRSADIHKADYYVKEPKEPHEEFATEVLGCDMKRTAVQHRAVLNSIVKKAYGSDTDKAENVMMEIQESINDMLEEEKPEKDGLMTPIAFEESVISEILEESGVHEDKAEEILNSCRDEFKDDVPTVECLLDTKAIKANAPVKREKELVKEVLELKDKLKKSNDALAGFGITDVDRDLTLSDEEAAYYADDNSSEEGRNVEQTAGGEVTEKNGSLLIKVNTDKADQIRTEIINGRKCAVIPMDDDEEIEIVTLE